jgi:hypothetical protein
MQGAPCCVPNAQGKYTTRTYKNSNMALCFFLLQCDTMACVIYRLDAPSFGSCSKFPRVRPSLAQHADGHQSQCRYNKRVHARVLGKILPSSRVRSYDPRCWRPRERNSSNQRLQKYLRHEREHSERRAVCQSCGRRPGPEPQQTHLFWRLLIPHAGVHEGSAVAPPSSDSPNGVPRRTGFAWGFAFIGLAIVYMFLVFLSVFPFNLNMRSVI